MSTRARVTLVALAASAAFLSLSCGCKPPKTAGPGDGTGPGTGPVTSPSPEPSPDPGSGPRAAALQSNAANYDRLEGTSFQNACGADADCIASGCSGEVCAAEAVNSTCDVQVDKPAGNCGCVEGLCIWYKGGGGGSGGGGGGGGGAPAPSGEACSGHADCIDGKQCLEYYGIAGPNGPKFSSCEWSCADGKTCPKGTKCTTIADGPGEVCR